MIVILLCFLFFPGMAVHAEEKESLKQFAGTEEL